MNDVVLRRVRQDDLPDAHWARILRDERNVLRTVELEGQPAGNIGSWEQDGERLVGYWIGREHWGRGVATAALTAFLEVVRTRPLHAHVATANPASIRVLEKCGFKRASAPVVAGDGIEELRFRLD